MTLDEARENIGRSVVYCPAHGSFEDGLIKSVNDRYVMVDYQGNVKATAPEDLWLKTTYNLRDACLDWKSGN